MFDFAWSEIALVGVVALVAIGPKDMPVAIKAVASMVKKARRMAGEFQTHVDDLMKEADLSEMRSHLSELRSINLRGTVERALDPDGSLRAGFAPPSYTPPAEGKSFVEPRPEHRIRTPNMMDPPRFAGAAYNVPPPYHMRPDLAAAPAFIPPEAVAAEHAYRAAPAFIPPEHATRPLPTAA